MWEGACIVLALANTYHATRPGLTDQARRNAWSLANLWLAASIIIGALK